MWSYKKSAVAVATALVMACAGAGSASATTFSPTSTAFVLSSANSSLAVSGGGTISCTGSTISGTTPGAGAATTLTANVTLAYTGCTAFLFPATVTVPATCGAGGATPIKLHTMYNTASSIAAQVTILSGCNIVVDVPAITCTVTFAGAQTVGNGTSGTGGIGWSNGSPTVRSTLTATNATVPSVSSSGGGFGCPSAGAHTGTLFASYQVTTPATNPGVTVGP